MRRSTLLAVGALALVVPITVVERLRLTRFPRAPLGAELSGRAGAGGDPTVLMAASGDLLVLGGLLLLGGLLVPRALPVGVLRPAVALLTGVGLQATLGLLLLRWPLSAVILVGTTIALARLLRRRGVATGWRRGDALPLAVGLGLIAATSAVSRTYGLAAFSHDSWSYWWGGEQLAAGTLGVADLEMKRMLALQALYAPGFGLGVDSVVSLGPVLLVVAVLWLALLPWVMSPRPTWPVLVAGGLVALLVAASPWFAWVAVYVNSHLLVSVMLLLIVSLAYLTGEDGTGTGGTGTFRTALVPIALAASTVALARTEGFVVVGLVLLGGLRWSGEGWRDWTPVWWVLGGVVAWWNVLLRLGAEQSGSSRLVPTLGIAVGLLLIAAPTLLARIDERPRRAIPVAASVVLWSAAAVLLLTPIGERIVFAEMVRLNLGEGLGLWYLTAPIVALTGAFGIALTADRPALTPARWLLVGFMPVTLLARLSDGIEGATGVSDLATALLSGGGRTSEGDSATRMWTHVALVALVTLVLALVERDRGRAAPDRRRTVAPVAALLMLLLVAAWWRPGYLGPVGPVTATVIASSVTDRPGPELSAGAVVTQRVTVPDDLGVPDDVRFLQVCADIAFAVPFERPDGRFLITMTGGDTVTEALNRGEATEPGTVKTICIEPGLPLPAEIGLELTGIGGPPGRSVITTVDAAGGFVREASVIVDAPSLDPRGPLARGLSWTFRRAVQLAPIAFGLALIPLLAPPGPGRRRGEWRYP